MTYSRSIPDAMSSDAKRRRLLFAKAVTLLLLFVMLSSMALVSHHERAMEFEVARWPVTNVKILQSHVGSHVGRSARIYFTPDITYEYVANGAAMRSNRVFNSRWSTTDLAGVRQVVDRYPEGASSIAHYKPGNPAFAVLTSREQGSDWALGDVGLIVSGMIGVFVVLMTGTRTAAVILGK